MIIIPTKYVMTFVESFLYWNRTETGIGTEPKEYGVLGIWIKKKMVARAGPPHLLQEQQDQTSEGAEIGKNPA